MTNLQTLPQDVALLDMPMYAHQITADHSMIICERCKNLKNSGYSWLFDVILTSQLLDRYRSNETLYFLLQQRQHDGITQLTCKSQNGKTVFTTIFPRRRHQGKPLKIAFEENMAFLL